MHKRSNVLWFVVVVAAALGASSSVTAGQSKTCGGSAQIRCDLGDYCQISPKECHAANGAGVCKASPQMCPMIYVPVCGCDGKTYPNECTANSHGVSVASGRPCNSAAIVNMG